MFSYFIWNIGTLNDFDLISFGLCSIEY